MARARGNAQESSYGFVLLAILYGIITGIAVWVGIYSKPEMAFKVQLVCSAIASIIFVFILPKNNDYTCTRKRASYIFAHLLLWGGILFLPFGDYPKLSLAAVLLLGISEAGYVAALNSDENTTRSNDSKINAAQVAGRLAMLILALVIILFVAKATGYDKKAIGWYEDLIGLIESSKKDSEPSDDATDDPVVNKSSELTASFKQWGAPMVLNASGPFTTKASGKVDLNDNTNRAVNVVIYLKTSGNILLVNGSVERADQNGGKCVGVWKQPQTGLSGSYVLDVLSSGYAHLILRHNNVDVAEIELN